MFGIILLLTYWVHDFNWVSGSTRLARTSLVLCSYTEDVFLVFNNIIDYS